MKLWLDQGQCTGSGLCALIAPDVFEVGAEGVSTLLIGEPGAGTSPQSAVDVPEELQDRVIEASQGCVGACIYAQ